MTTIKRLTNVSDKFNGYACVYKLSESVPYNFDWDTDKYLDETLYVVISAANVPYSGIETFMFPSDKDGNILDWGEMSASEKGTLSHQDIIDNTSWELVD